MSVSPNWPTFVGLQQRAITAKDATELAFLIANETWHLLPYRQSLVFVDDTFARASDRGLGTRQRH